MKKAEFALLPAEAIQLLIGCSSTAIRVYLSLRLVCDYGDSGVCDCSQTEIGAIIGVSPGLVSRAEKELHNVGLITRKTRGGRRSAVQVNFLRCCDIESQAEKQSKASKDGEMALRCDIESQAKKEHVTIEHKHVTIEHKHHYKSNKESMYARARARNDDTEPHRVVVARWNEIVPSATGQPKIDPERVVTHTQDLIRNHWHRHGEMLEPFERVFRAYAEREGLRSRANVSFSKLWTTKHPEGASWFDLLAEGGMSGGFWSSDTTAIPLLSDVLSGKVRANWGRGVQVDCEVTNGTETRFCELLRDRNRAQFDELLSKACESFRRARAKGIPEDEVSSVLRSSRWDAWEHWGGLLGPVIDEARRSYAR